MSPPPRCCRARPARVLIEPVPSVSAFLLPATAWSKAQCSAKEVGVGEDCQDLPSNASLVRGVHVATPSIATAWVAVIGTASGAVLGGAASLITAYLQRRWTHDDRVEELKRGAEEAARTSRVESDAAVLRALRPLINELEHQWNRLGGGPEPSAGPVGERGKEFADAAATFERQFYHGILHDTESQKLVSQLYWACGTSPWRPAFGRCGADNLGPRRPARFNSIKRLARDSQASFGLTTKC